MEDGEHCCIASPPDTSVTSSTSCTDDQSGKTAHMSNNVHFSDEDTEVSSSCEMQSAHTACSSAAVDPLDPQVTTVTHYSHHAAVMPHGKRLRCSACSRTSICLTIIHWLTCVKITKWIQLVFRIDSLRLPSASAPSHKIKLLS